MAIRVKGVSHRFSIFYLRQQKRMRGQGFTGRHNSSNSNLRKRGNGRPDTCVFMPRPESSKTRLGEIYAELKSTWIVESVTCVFCPRCGHDIVISLTSITVLYLSMPLIRLHLLPLSLRFLLPLLPFICYLHVDSYPKPKTEHNFRLAYAQSYSRTIRDTATIPCFGLSPFPLSHI